MPDFYEEKPRDHSYFTNLGKEASLAKLAEQERAGTLVAFLKEVAPDYVAPGSNEPMVFTLVQDLGY
jgi:hypothetical protein